VSFVESSLLFSVPMELFRVKVQPKLLVALAGRGLPRKKPNKNAKT
jgi:hypothetical protein